MVPNLYVAIICPQYCLLDRLFVVDTFRNFGNAKKVASGAGSVDAIYRHRKFPGGTSRGYDGTVVVAGLELKSHRHLRRMLAAMRRASFLVSKPPGKIFQSEQLCTEIIASLVQLFVHSVLRPAPSPRLRSARVS